jgi:hypothetical protein
LYDLFNEGWVAVAEESHDSVDTWIVAILGNYKNVDTCVEATTKGNRNKLDIQEAFWKNLGKGTLFKGRIRQFIVA